MPSPPPPFTPLSPAPSQSTLSERRARRARQRVTMPPHIPGTDVSSPAVSENGESVTNVTDSGSECGTHGNNSPATSLLGLPPVKSYPNSSRLSSSVNDTRNGPGSIQVPKLVSPFPSHFRYPSPTPSCSSSITSASNGASSLNTSSYSPTTSSCTSTSESVVPSTSQSRANSHSRRKTITAFDQFDYANDVMDISRDGDATPSKPVIHVVPPSQSPPSGSPTTSSIHSFSRSRGRSISRSVRKVASVFALMNLKKDTVEPETIPEVPKVPSRHRSVILVVCHLLVVDRSLHSTN